MLFLLLAACPSAPSKDVALRAEPLPTFQCQSSSECSHNSNGCNYCYQGACSCTLPTEPIHDAGIDAAPGGTSH